MFYDATHNGVIPIQENIIEEGIPQPKLQDPEYNDSGFDFEWYEVDHTDICSEFDLVGSISDISQYLKVDVDTDANGVLSHFIVYKVEGTTYTVMTGENKSTGDFSMVISSRGIVDGQIVQGPSLSLSIDSNWLNVWMTNPGGAPQNIRHVRTELIGSP